MSKTFIPRDYQHIMIDHIIEHPRCAIWAQMGLGKTAGTLTAIDMLKVIGELDGPALILAPLRVAQSVWPEEVQKWKHLNDLTVSVICGNVKQRQAALRVKADIYTINYENIVWLIKELKTQGREWSFKMVVADESTKLKSLRVSIQTHKKSGKKFLTGQGGSRAKALAKIAFKYQMRIVELSGTPSPNGLQDLWGQLWFLDGGRRLGRTFEAFKQRWFKPKHNGYGIEPLPHAQEQIETAAADLCVSLNAADYFDLEEPIVTEVKVDMPPKAKKLYKDMEKKMFLEIKEHEVEAFNAASRTMKCLQLANGAIYVGEDAKEWEEVHDAKLKALEEIIAEAAGMPVLVAYHFRSDLGRLRKRFPKGRVLDKQASTIRAWNAGKLPLLFAHPASAGHGLNLQDGGNILVFFSLNWNLEEHDQIIERIGPVRQAQAGHERPVFIYYIMAKGTVDKLVKERLETKREIQDILMQAMKYKEVA